MNGFDENQHPRDSYGRFSDKKHDEVHVDIGGQFVISAESIKTIVAVLNYEEGAADVAAEDPHPAVRCAALGGWDLPDQTRNRLLNDPDVMGIFNAITVEGADWWNQ